MAKKDPVFLVVVDESEEMHQALQFACGRAKTVARVKVERSVFRGVTGGPPDQGES